MQITFEMLPAAVATMQNTLNALMVEVKELRKDQPVNEQPITGTELRKRLNISRPTEIAMRKKGKLPYLMVNGNYRYNWQDVQKKLANQ
jgi:hypothetical protein